jgi:hypothetical protein
MKKALFLMLAAALVISCGERTPLEEEPAVMTIAEFLLRAHELDSTVVHVQGLVDHLCMGSRAKIHFVCPDDSDESIKIFAGEEVDEFSDTLVGKIITVKGLVAVSTRIDDAYLDEWEEELADKAAGHHHHGEGEGHDHSHDVDEPETHHHGNQQRLIEKYRKMIRESGQGYINLYKIIVSEVKPAGE